MIAWITVVINAAVCTASAFCKDQSQLEQSTKTCFTAIINLLFERDGAVGLERNTLFFCFLLLYIFWAVELQFGLVSALQIWLFS